MRCFAVVLLVLAAQAAAAQAGTQASAGDLGAALRADQAAHLWRVGAWGLANAVGGAALVLTSSRDDDPGRWAFGLQSGAWGAINVGIAAVGLATAGGDLDAGWAAAHAAENGYADVLLVNLGLNVGYMAVGGTLLAVAGRGVSRPDEWRGHGAALVVQGLGLFVLDGVAYLGSRTRLGELVNLVEVGAAGVSLVVPL